MVDTAPKVGSCVGPGVGWFVGTSVGASVGSGVGILLIVGSNVGDVVGSGVATMTGACVVTEEVGTAVALPLVGGPGPGPGATVGSKISAVVGAEVAEDTVGAGGTTGKGVGVVVPGGGTSPSPLVPSSAPSAPSIASLSISLSRDSIVVNINVSVFGNVRVRHTVSDATGRCCILPLGVQVQNFGKFGAECNILAKAEGGYG